MSKQSGCPFVLRMTKSAGGIPPLDHQRIRFTQVQVRAIAKRKPVDGFGELNDPDPFMQFDVALAG